MATPQLGVIQGTKPAQADLFPAIPAEVTARINKAIADPNMSGCARAVLIVLAGRPAVGRARAISIADLQRVFRYRMAGGESAAGVEYTDRQIKGAVKQLIEDYGVPVGSSRQEPHGYYICQDSADRINAVRPIRAEIVSLLKRWKTLDTQSDIGLELAGQIAMEHSKA
jgi:hypothetical protein